VKKIHCDVFKCPLFLISLNLICLTLKHFPQYFTLSQSMSTSFPPVPNVAFVLEFGLGRIVIVDCRNV
jgi:hypothetical protein